VVEGGLSELAGILEGFPKDSLDVRELEFGAGSMSQLGGYVHPRFSCRDRAGHTIVEVQIESRHEYRAPDSPIRGLQKVQFYAGVEPSAVDVFVKELRQLCGRDEGSAWLAFRNISS